MSQDQDQNQTPPTLQASPGRPGGDGCLPGEDGGLPRRLSQRTYNCSMDTSFPLVIFQFVDVLVPSCT